MKKNAVRMVLVVVCLALSLGNFASFGSFFWGSLGVSPAQGAALKGRATVTAEQGWNPQPQASDVLLPMPCGLSMAFVPVEVPSLGFLWDADVNLGCENCDREGMEYYERRFPQAIAGPFSPKDFPAELASKLPTTPNVSYTYYLMGKYEVSDMQWNAVMGQCSSAAPDEKAIAPKTEISWYDAVEFSRRYNQWLVENAPKSLPRFANDTKNVGYARLPTEAEWEYAARGGNRVSPDALRQNDFYELAPDTTLSDYAAYRAEGAARILEGPQRIGSRRPNPLGLYDMAGNVAEMMLETFHFSLGGRLHGSAGGILRKGGSFSASEAEIRPGRREEIPLFHQGGATQTRDTGFRLVLSGINTPDGGRTEILKAEWKTFGEKAAQKSAEAGTSSATPLSTASGTAVPPGQVAASSGIAALSTSATPIQTIDSLMAEASDPEVRQRLARLRGVIKDSNVALEKEKGSTADGLLRTVAYMLETTRNYGVRRSVTMDTIAKLDQFEKQISDKKSPLYAKNRQLQEDAQKGYAGFVKAMHASVMFYRARLDDVAALPDPVFTQYMALLKQSFAGDDVFNRNMTQNLVTMEKHLSLVRAGKGAQLTRKKLLEDIVPAQLRKDLEM